MGINADLHERAHVSDGGVVEVFTPNGGVAQSMTLSCPRCGSVSKADHEAGMRICFNKGCRNRFPEKQSVVGVGGAKFPCSKCGKETKEHHTPKSSRICSSRNCNHVEG